MDYPITDRLRCKYNGRDFSGPMQVTLPTAIMLEAAEEIDRLTTENAMLIAAKSVRIVPPAMPESETIRHLQKLLAEAHVEISRSNRATADLRQRLTMMDDALGRTEEALKDAQGEVESLAVAIWREHYKDESPEWRLCDSVAGVISQINNMTAGLEESLITANSRAEELTGEVERLQSMVSHSGDGTCDHCGCSPARAFNVCESCADEGAREVVTANSRVERLRQALERIAMYDRVHCMGDRSKLQGIARQAIAADKALADDAKEVK